MFFSIFSMHEHDHHVLGKALDQRLMERQVDGGVWGWALGDALGKCLEGRDDTNSMGVFSSI